MAWLVVAACALGANAHACDAVLGPPQQGIDGSWHYAATAFATTFAALDVRVRESQQDVDLSVGVEALSATSDIPPTRYALERVAVPFWRSVRASVRVRANEASTTEVLPVEVRCFDVWDRRWLPALLRTQAADVAFHAMRETTAERMARAQADALARTALWRASAFDGDELAGAAMLAGYLQRLLGRSVDAAASYKLAETTWSASRADGLAYAARFYRAQALLGAGHADEADALLVGLTSNDVEMRYPLIAGWARNDRCAALRAAGRSAESVDCFAAVLPLFEAAGERREAANVVCNMGAMLGTLQRWSEALAVLERCRSARQAIGTPSGLAHATLLLGWASLEHGDIDAAAELLEQSLGYARTIGDRGRMWDARRWLAQVWIESDAVERARALLADSEPDAVQDALRHADWQSSLGALALLREEFDEAGRRLRAAVDEYSALKQRLGVERAQCRLALIDRAAPVPSGCDALLLAEIARRRGARDAELAALRVRQHAQDAELLRRLLLELASTGARRTERLREIVASAYALGARSARGSGARERLLSRFGFELAHASARESDAALARLAVVALLGSGERSALPSVALAPLSSAPFDADGKSRDLPALPRLGADEVFVVSTSYFGTAYLLVVRDGERLDVIALDTTRVRRGVASLLATIAGQQPTADAAIAAADALGLRRWLAPDVRRLRLLVHRELVQLPWAALAIDGAPLGRLNYRPLADRVTTSFVVPGAARPRAMPRRVAIVGAAAAGNESLPGVAFETALLRDAALRANWEVVDLTAGTAAGIAPVGILHIGGHATADRRERDGGAFYVRGDDGWQRLALSDTFAGRASIVVLAGCETADGAPSRLGNRSWGSRVVERGAAMSLAHLWAVEDTAAMRLHRAFYAAIFDGADADVALALAQRERMRQRVDAAPRRWASGVVFARFAADGGDEHD